MADLAEWIKTFGALAGLAAVAFLVYDRMFKSRPFLSVIRHNQAALRIINPIEDDLLILSIECQPRQLLAIAAADSIDGIARAVPNQSANDLLVAGGKEARLPIVLLKGGPQAAEQSVKITVRWRRSRNIWPLVRRTSIRTSYGHVKQIESAKSVSRDSKGNRA